MSSDERPLTAARQRGWGLRQVERPSTFTKLALYVDWNMLDEDFHVHIYFTAETRTSALAIRTYMETTDTFETDLQPVREMPIGPHPTPMFNAHLDKANFGPAMHWLMLNHGPHSVLIHPNTGDDLKDHTEHALWLAGPLDLNLDNL